MQKTQIIAGAYENILNQIKKHFNDEDKEFLIDMLNYLDFNQKNSFCASTSLAKYRLNAERRNGDPWVNIKKISRSK
jgi:hypothetical protein